MNINHGYVIAKKDTILNIPEGTKGIITAYLPEQDGGTFAVKFTDGPWLTFKESKDCFISRFKEVQVNEQ